MRSYLRLLRVSHWVKNLFLFLPVFFAGDLFHWETVARLIGGFFCFSLSSGAVYIFNDYMDIESDKLHNQKRNRPLAAGEITPISALSLAGFSVVVSLGGAFAFDNQFVIILSIYLINNILYSSKLKHIPILDLTIIAIGFILRIFAGGALTETPISNWLVLMTFLLALFLGLSKRRDDVLIFRRDGDRVRRSIDGYNLDFINASMVMMSSVLIVSYIMYTVSEQVISRIGHDDLYLTVFFVVLGLLRYLQISLVHNDSGSPTKILLKDRFIQITIFGWIVAFYFLLYR
ncbi:MAG: decaprenyl-phosphate phosphoribosyltransferase [Candidatus Cloacimonetes bacterium 4572_55]|nr:MAG: decaprenyl-phosphate phosphoribosyltransferase [Candidatus Cloacimonetes bacterium 4572_55]